MELLSSRTLGEMHIFVSLMTLQSGFLRQRRLWNKAETRVFQLEDRFLGNYSSFTLPVFVEFNVVTWLCCF